MFTSWNWGADSSYMPSGEPSDTSSAPSSYSVSNCSANSFDQALGSDNVAAAFSHASECLVICVVPERVGEGRAS